MLSCLLLAPSTVKAADLVVYAPPVVVDGKEFTPPVVTEPPYNDTPSWGGGYIGVNAGWVRGNFKHPVREYFRGKTDNITYDNRDSVDFTSNSFVGGVQIGYNWSLTNNIVAGFETDFQKTNLRGNGDYVDEDMLSAYLKINTSVDWFGTVRGRIGYTPVDNILFYVTGGFAYGEVKTHLDKGTHSFYQYVHQEDFYYSDVTKGWTAGAGAEYAINSHWNLKVEYLYVDLGKKSLYAKEYSEGDPGLFVDREVSLQTVRVGLNYKF